MGAAGEEGLGARQDVMGAKAGLNSKGFSKESYLGGMQAAERGFGHFRGRETDQERAGGVEQTISLCRSRIMGHFPFSCLVAILLSLCCAALSWAGGVQSRYLQHRDQKLVPQMQTALTRIPPTTD